MGHGETTLQVHTTIRGPSDSKVPMPALITPLGIITEILMTVVLGACRYPSKTSTSLGGFSNAIVKIASELELP